jgi:hypothetical protein
VQAALPELAEQLAADIPLISIKLATEVLGDFSQYRAK